MTEIKKAATLPTIEELSQDTELAFKNDQLNLLLNKQPPADWVKEHPITKQKYIPIEKVEFLLTKIFQRWEVKVIGYSQLFQSVAVHVRLTVYNPINGEYISHDGLGAAPIQTDAGASAADLSKIKSAAVMIALPSAESYAIKDAAEKFGRVFGKDLNRKNLLTDEHYNKLATRWQ
jgi:hypothetical protein